MTEPTVLKEFVVKLSYQIDEASQRKFQRGLEGATAATFELGKALAAVSAGIAVAAAKIGQNLDELYYQAQRTNAGAQSIKAMGYAVSQLGGSYREALGSIEAFSAKLRQNPGYESMVRQLGVVTRQNGKLRDTVDIMQDLGNALQSKPYYVAYQYANSLGIDEKTFQAMRSGEYQRRMDEFRKKAAEMGV